MTIIALAVFVMMPIAIYIIFNLPPVQRFVTRQAETEVERLLGVPVKVGSIDIALFNKVFVDDILIAYGTDTILTVDRLGGGIRLGKLITSRQLVFSFAEIINPRVELWKDSTDAPLNIQPIIERLSKKDDNSKPKHFDLSINSVVVRGGHLGYNVRSESRADSGRFDRNHISVSGIKADILVPRLSNDNISIHIKRLALEESSGLSINNLQAFISANDSLTSIRPLTLSSGKTTFTVDSIMFRYNNMADFLKNPLTSVFSVDISKSHIAASDFTPLLPDRLPLDEDCAFDLTLNVKGNSTHASIDNFSLTETHGGFSLHIPTVTIDNYLHRDSLHIDVKHIRASIDGHRLGITDRHLSDMASQIGPLTLDADATINGDTGSNASLHVNTLTGSLTARANISDVFDITNSRIKTHIESENMHAGQILGLKDMGEVCLTADADVRLRDKKPEGNAAITINRLQYRGYDYQDICIYADADKKSVSVNMQSSDVNAMIDISADLQQPWLPSRRLRSKSHIYRLDLNAIGITDRYPDKILSGKLDISLQGEDIRNLNGRIEVDNLMFADSLSNGISLDHFSFLTGGNASSRYSIIHSDILDGKIEGRYDMSRLPLALQNLITETFPDLFPDARPQISDSPSDITVNLTLRENATTNNWLTFFKSPVKILYPVTLTADFSEAEHSLSALLEAPYLIQKDKFIDNTSLSISIDGTAQQALAHATTVMPTKHGPTDFIIDLNSSGGITEIGTRWSVDTRHRYEGLVSLSGKVARDTSGKFYANASFSHSECVFNDTTWTIRPSELSYNDRILSINNFEVFHSNQYIRIDGTASDSPMDRITLQLQDIDLDYVFEALAIPTAMFGGTATGDFYASQVLTPTPILYTPKLFVKDFKYNDARLGDASIVSSWNPETQGIKIDADILGDDQRHSTVDGAIYPMRQGLDFKFDTDSINIAFLRPFMSAFTSEVTGRASGHAHLYGTFADVNLTGDVFAQDFTIKIDYTNTRYHVTDSVHITPGYINFDNITIRDDFGHTARFNGYLGHDYFHNPWFEFRLSDARDLLCYDITPKLNPDWYGRIFCNGSAFVKGEPGFIDLNINVSTAANSVFNFVLSDTQAASEYTFLEFRDRNAASSELLLSVENPSSASVQRLKKQYAETRRKAQMSQATRYRINLQVDATPQAEMILVMDPVGGDRIKAHGSGNLRMEYNSASEDFKMFGSYVLAQGTYNFTLQDIIIKDFTIKPGSTIAFHGDPMNATLDIQATYAVNANLSDLDESFLQDKDLNRTNVPVHALLKVNGDIHQPEISFDLEFPTLTQDTYRKVRSIVSTDDMMNRQIIYLLALNRFYTPDYMNVSTRSNELMSVASSTISSQLSSILGQISDNWTIAPNFRSDRGDFTDMEVDVALSSHLLNNRLLFNGNLGYRDKSMNTNTFVGDFDIEYLLNKSGSVRLKAYNRYNDQNYFVKSALTTQGVGVVYKKDFDNMFDFLRRKKSKASEPKKAEVEQPADDGQLLQFTPRD